MGNGQVMYMATGAKYDEHQLGKSCMPENVEPVHWGGSGDIKDYLKTINDRNKLRKSKWSVPENIDKSYGTSDETQETVKFL